MCRFRLARSLLLRYKRIPATTQGVTSTMHRLAATPFPFTLPKSGALVTDERCKCGALRSEHVNTFAFGHGSRIVDGLTVCERFTWMSWVFTTMALPPRFQGMDDRHVIKIERANTRNVGAKGWRYEVRDMSAAVGGVKLLTCAAPAARTKAEALEHARIELARALERKESQTVRAALGASVARWDATAERRAAVDAELANANAHNRAVVEGEQLNARRAAAQRMIDDRRKEYTEGTKLIDKIDAKKLAFLSAAELPVPGLSIADECVTLNGVPLEQASGAEKLRVALGIAIAAQSEIKDILIRDASLLDDESLRIVEEVATNAGCRAWLERVGTRDPGAIIIRDGQIATDEVP